MDDTKQTNDPRQCLTDDALRLMAESIRADAAALEQGLRALANAAKARIGKTGDPALEGETVAQAMIAVRAAEDCRMRVGKVLQYGVQGGIPWAGKEPG